MQHLLVKVTETAKQQKAEKVAEAAAVVVTKPDQAGDIKPLSHIICIVACFTLFASNTLHAAVLPEDKAEISLPQYSGDNSTFRGPAVLVRKQFAEKVSVWGKYMVDMNTAASIDIEE